MVKVCIDRVFKEKNPYEYRSSLINGIKEGNEKTDKRWKNGQTLQISFLNGSSTVQNKVKEYAMQWLSYANINFKWDIFDQSDVRIGFKWNGDITSWSYIGTDSLNVSNNEPTMNFGWIDENTIESEYFIVLHEFGHMLGLIHDFQFASDSWWNKKKIIDDLLHAKCGYNIEDIEYNIFKRYTRNYVNGDLWGGIMFYIIPSEWILDGLKFTYSTTLNYEDQATIMWMYPFDTNKSNKMQKSEVQYIPNEEYVKILKLRLVKGEITKKEYFELLNVIDDNT